ncbi:MAG: hypothetical protein OWQ59_11395 [Alicyclobacillaceae bacterium]|nr:hypothetical protein [Alicyclobacillaceae bacterium]MCY0894852.1 hypothetical protein [Alicyclobacillaceae bacterium]
MEPTRGQEQGAARYHCCATCKHFRVRRTDSGVHAQCARLGYETKASYRFNCWDPRPDIRERIEKDGERRS